MRLFRFLNWLLFHSGLSIISFVQIETSSSLFTVSSDAPEFMMHYSQQEFVEESVILQNTVKSFQSIFRVLCNMHILDIAVAVSVCIGSMAKQLEF